MSVSLAIRSFLKAFKESRYFTEASCQEINGQLIHATLCRVQLSFNKHYVKENSKAILKNSSEAKNHGNNTKHKEGLS